MRRYRTIVADPPWDHSDGTGRHLGERKHRLTDAQRERAPESHLTYMPYSCMSLEDICALPVSGMAERDAHLYLWTTNRYLRDAYYVAEAWGFSPVKPLVWVKQPMGFMGGTFTSSVEFVLFSRRGSLPHTSARAGRQWWLWPRGEHSAKPEAFMDIVEQVSPGPYLEMFARRQRLGWDTWGNEALEHVSLAAVRQEKP
jgi:N6-adenosine-specific RNA methylase IME4